MNHYQETFNTWDKVAQLYAEKFMDLNIYNQTYDFLLKQVNLEKSTLLELGCGPANISKYLFNKNPSLIIKGIDVSPNMIQIAKKNIPTARFEVLDIRDIDQLNQQFNVIICGFVIPYLNHIDTEKLLINCKNKLSKNGLLYLSFVHGNIENSGYISGSSGDRTYFNYYDKYKLEKDLNLMDFNLLKEFEIIYNKTANKTETHTVFILRKN